MNNSAPYKTVLTHGFVVDEQGRNNQNHSEMLSLHKSMGQLRSRYFKTWVASTDFRSEMVASDEILKRTSDQYRRIRNTFRFILET